MNSFKFFFSVMYVFRLGIHVCSQTHFANKVSCAMHALNFVWPAYGTSSYDVLYFCMISLTLSFG
ncbi:hypothetical protein HanRHA438_Chr02g0082611 [Helianthus annuus]|nr:hypothetical protein HanRHA438_Chr02g0082611 [Helianthus annuus]